MKKYTDNIGQLYENSASIDKMLKGEVEDLYRPEVKRPAFTEGGLKTGEPDALSVLSAMKRLVDKYTTVDSNGALKLKTQSEIESYH
jgi:hypothetical protein